MEQSSSSNAAIVEGDAWSDDDQDVLTVGVSNLSLVDSSSVDKDDSMEEFFNLLYKDFPMQVAKQISRVHFPSSTLAILLIAITRTSAARTDTCRLRSCMARSISATSAQSSPRFSGRPVFAAALLHDFDECVGYEILEGLAHVAMDVAAIWHREKKDANLPPLKKRTRIVIHHDDATAVGDWPSADFIFCNSTCFDERLMRAVSKHAIAAVKAGGVVVTATKPLILETQDAVAAVALVSTCKMQESWGPATLYIYKRS
ncbi:hypothetical protein DYB32_000983 [Aphanomyces invadans]|uniref:Histone H3-K79 methyltransferase n=1 Tax=Aphanomyces invadans TaxID=157072 RepID=A0A418B858_9STRA|nr:hypothetical protein DYB32_000983 [Aphanomyces invadans]